VPAEEQATWFAALWRIDHDQVLLTGSSFGRRGDRDVREEMPDVFGPVRLRSGNGR